MKITSPDGKIVRNCRLVYEHDTTTVYQWDAALGTANALLTAAGRPDRLGATTSYEVAGQRVDTQRGCGCSHPMFAWVPQQ
ncbi:MAG TPA: hypothetical protein VGM93_14525 [Acidimicrobiales bacterium]